MKYTAGERTLMKLCSIIMLALAALLLCLPPAANAAVILECSLADLTDEPAKVRGHYVAIMREDGRRATYRHLPYHRAYQIFAGNGPQMQQEYLCLPPMPEFDPQGDDDE